MPRPLENTASVPAIPDTMDDEEEHEIVVPQGRSEVPSVPMFDVELIEIIADLLSSIAGNITQHFADDLAFLSGKKGGNKKILSPGQQRSLQLIQVFEHSQSVNNTISLLSHLRSRFIMFFTTSAEHKNSQLILHEGVKVLHVMEKTTSLINDLYALKSTLVSEISSHQVQWNISVSEVIEHLTALLEYVNNTTASMDESTKSGEIRLIDFFALLVHFLTIFCYFLSG